MDSTKETMEFSILMGKLESEMWSEKDKRISDYAKKGGKKPYRFDDNFYTTANDLKWRWSMNYHLKEEVKIIKAPKGSMMHKCRIWLVNQHSHGVLDMMNPKCGCISNARFKRRDKPWGTNTDDLMVDKPKITHIDDGDSKAYCQSRKKKTDQKRTGYYRYGSRFKSFIRTTKNKDEVTCKQCMNLMKSCNPDIQREIIILTLQNDN